MDLGGADVEAGLDFADEDIHFVDQKEMLLRGKINPVRTLLGLKTAAATAARRLLREGRAP